MYIIQFVNFLFISVTIWGCPPLCTKSDRQVVHCVRENDIREMRMLDIIPREPATEETMDVLDDSRVPRIRLKSLNLAGSRRIVSSVQVDVSVIQLFTQIEPIKDIILDLAKNGISFKLHPDQYIGLPERILYQCELAFLVEQQWAPGQDFPVISIPAILEMEEYNLVNLFIKYINWLNISDVKKLFSFESRGPLYRSVVIPRCIRSSKSVSAPIPLTIDPKILLESGPVLLIDIIVSSRSCVVSIPLRLSAPRVVYLLTGFISHEYGQVHTVYRHLSKTQVGQDYWYWDNGLTLRKVQWTVIQKRLSALPQMAVYQRVFDISPIYE